MKKNTPIWLMLLLPLGTLVGMSGCTAINLANPYATEYDPGQGLTEEEIMTHFNLHRGRWWNYYRRGAWLLAHGHYLAARTDFQTAIDKRSRDRWDARTYGMHFIDYFPHRESGIAWYLEGQQQTDAPRKSKFLKHAMDQLKTSLQQTASSKAYFYLKRASDVYWEDARHDTTPPIVTFSHPAIDRQTDPPELYTNSSTILLKVRATEIGADKPGTTDVSGLAEVRVNNHLLYVDSMSDLQKQTVITLGQDQSIKTIRATATDLANNSSQPRVLRIILDANAPTAAIDTQTEHASLTGYVPVRILAQDDHGLREVQVGRHPHDRRDCQGRRDWEGLFQIKQDVQEIFVKVVDRAGNATATHFLVERPAQAHHKLNPQLSTPRHSLTPAVYRWSYSPASLAQQHTGLDQWPLAQPLMASPFPASPVSSGVKISLASRPRLSRAKLVFPDFRNRSTVTTSYDTYVLQGEVRYAKGLTEIHVLANQKTVDNIRMRPQSANSMLFSSRIKLPRGAKTSINIEVKAIFQDGTCIDHGPAPLQVKKVPNAVNLPEAVYSVMLLPLAEKLPPADNDFLPQRTGEAQSVVLDALRSCPLHDPCQPRSVPLPRFNCEALANWSSTEIDRILGQKGHATKSPEEKFSKLNASGLDAELGFFGSVEETPETLEIILTAIGVKNKKILVRKIDTFGEKDDYEWLKEGLIARLQSTIPRVYGSVDKDLSKNQSIWVDCGDITGVFKSMSMGFYDQSNGLIEHFVHGDVTDVHVDNSVEVLVEDKAKWRLIRSAEKSVLVVSK